MHNHTISDNFSLLSKLTDIHGDDPFKAKSYAAAAFTIDKLPVQLASLEPEKIFAIKGIGQATGKKILEQIASGRLPQLEEYIAKTPPGILELLKIKGLGPKKIATIWKDLGVESMGELLYACEENRLLLYKGFGEKTQQNTQQSIEFYLASKGSYLYSQIEDYAAAFTQKISAAFPSNKLLLTGDFNRQAPVIHKLEWITDADAGSLDKYFAALGYQTRITGETLWAKGAENVSLEFHSVGENITVRLFEHNCSPKFLAAWKEKYGRNDKAFHATEEAIFNEQNLPFIPPFLRETVDVLELAAQHALPEVITKKDIRGIIHSHSNCSDGKNTIEEMAEAAIYQGLEYLVISDHSQSAFYANGLYPNRIEAQHQLIDELNEKYRPFRIFKSIESDILNDGNLDYPDSVLATFDLVIASVHSNLKMSEEKAMARLLNAIANPYTTILGHMTGRLLLSRNGYPVNHIQIIEACSASNVVIELNAHPRRLDMDWRFINEATKRQVLISIDPDAHSTEAYADVKFGVLAAQKGGLTAVNNLSSFTLNQFENFLEKQKAKRK